MIAVEVTAAGMAYGTLNTATEGLKNLNTSGPVTYSLKLNGVVFFCMVLRRYLSRSLKSSATMLDPFPQFHQHCWGHARA